MTNLQQHQRHWKIFFLTSILILIGPLSFPSTVAATVVKVKLSKQTYSLIIQREWDKVRKIVPAEKDAKLYHQVYMLQAFLTSHDNCIKHPTTPCFNSTIKKWNELVKNFAYPKEFSQYLNDQIDTFITKYKQSERIRKAKLAERKRQEKIREEKRVKKEKEAREADLKTYRERANSDDAQSVTEAFFHGEARALVILHVEPNKLRVGGREFRVKRNPVGKGCFVYDPRTRFYGVKRNLVWWIPKEDKAYSLNSPSKMVTPGLKWPREEGVDAPSTFAVIDYVFEGKPMTAIAPSARPSVPKAGSYKVKEYRIYRAVISTPMFVSEAQAFENAAKRYGVTVAEAQKATKKVQEILSRNGWFGSPDSEIRHASDWKEEKP